MSTDPTPTAPRGPVPLGLSVVVAQLEAVDATAALDSVAAQLLETGAVTAEFRGALLERERTYPTGLPTPIPTAIPHADPQHVLRPGLALATLAAPVRFGEMGADGGELEVRLVAMPLLVDAQEHLAALQALMGLLSDGAAVAELLAAPDADALRARATEHLAALPAPGSAA